MTYRSKRLRRPTRGVLTLHLLTIALIVLPHPVVPATITVDGQTSDLTPGICDLVEAVQNALDDAQTSTDCAAGVGDDEIVLTVDVLLTQSADGDTDDGNGVPRINPNNGAVTISGNNFTVSRDAGATDNFRLFAVEPMGDLTLNDVTVTGGLVSKLNGDSLGGGLFNRGTLTLSNTTVSGNTAAGSVGAPNAYGGGIYNLGTLSITDSTISDNVAEADSLDTTLLLSRTGGAGISNCSQLCAAVPYPSLTIASSTISGNRSEVVAFDNYIQPSSYGGGLYAPVGDVEITNSTISGNISRVTGVDFPSADGAGIFLADASMILRSNTISGNTVDGGGGFQGAAGLEYFPFFAGSLDVYDSVVGNQYGMLNCYGLYPAQDGGNNLADDTSCATFSSSLDNLDPLLADNGGPTETHALLVGSTAVDAAGACPLLVDQRGVARPAGFCDSGSFELLACGAANGDTFVCAGPGDHRPT